MAQLLYYLDSGHFAEFLDRYKSKDYERHAVWFEDGGDQVENTSRKQWEVRHLAGRSA